MKKFHFYVLIIIILTSFIACENYCELLQGTDNCPYTWDSVDKNAPSGNIDVLNSGCDGNTYYCKTYSAILSLKEIEGAKGMRFTMDGRSALEDEEWDKFSESETVSLAGKQMPVTIYAEFRNNNKKTYITFVNIEVDTEKPTGTFTIYNDADSTTEESLVLNMSIEDADFMKFSLTESELDNVEWIEYSDVYTIDLPTDGENGNYTVYGQFKDYASNKLDAYDSIQVNTYTPHGTFAINYDDAYTNDTNVIIDISEVKRSDYMRFSNTATFADDWVAIPTDTTEVSWVLETGDGAKTVYGEFKDESDVSFSYHDDITLDMTDPAGTFVINNDDAMTNTASVVLNSNVSDVTAGTEMMRFGNDPSSLSGASWVSYNANYSWTIDGNGDGTKTVYAEYKDRAGNILSLSDDIEYDSTFPTGTFTINSGDNETNNTAVTLDLSNIQNVTQVRFSNDGMFDGDPEESWQTYAASLGWTLETGDGTKTVYGEFKDDSGDQISLDDSIVLDMTDPTGTFTINSGDAETNTTSVVLNSNISDATAGMGRMRFSNDGTYNETAENWRTYSSTLNWNLETGDGTKTVYAQYEDRAGNILSLTDTIELDTTYPNGTFTINNGASETTSTTVTLNLDNIHNTTEMRFSNDGMFDGDPEEDWQTYAASLVWTLETGDGTKTVYGEFKDNDGGSHSDNDSIILNTSSGAAPTIISSIPYDTQTGVFKGTTIIIIFDETMDTASVQSGFSTTPTTTGTFTWENQYKTNDKLIYTPNSNLTPDTEYTVELSGAEADGGSDPLNDSFSFTTATDPCVAGTTGDWVSTGVTNKNNLLCGASIISNTATSSGSLENITDGMIGTSWVGTGDSWVVIDLGENKDVKSITIKINGFTPTVEEDITITYTSDGCSPWDTIASFSGTYGPFIVNFAQTSMRYIKIDMSNVTGASSDATLLEVAVSSNFNL